MTDNAKQVFAFVKRKTEWLDKRKSEPDGRAALARLRRGVGKKPGTVPDLWQLTLEGLPEALLSKTGEPTIGENAAYAALTLYALHQQGKEKNMCIENISIGTALRRLIQISKDENKTSVTRRFNMAATSDSFSEISHHLRGLVQLLKSKDVPIYYPKLAEDLYWFQCPDGRDAIRLRWGQDFYRQSSNENQKEQEEDR